MKASPEIIKRNVAKAATLLKALANEQRLLILCHLLDGEHCVSELWAKSDLSQSAFSQHLAKLRADSLVKTRKEAQTIYYSLANNNGRKILEALQKIFC